MAKKRLRILAFGAHPDDCDIKLGGIAMLYARLGHEVRFVSVTNGDGGHFAIGGVELARRRYLEAQAAGRIAGVAYQVLDNHDGSLEPSFENRLKVIRIIREFDPDLVITHRPIDYHPDHRYTSQLVQDAAYMVTVPNVGALTPHLMHNPSVAYMADGFKKPNPFSPDVVVAIDDVFDRKLKMLACHESQFFEWLPYNANMKRVPARAAERLKWLKRLPLLAVTETADKYRDVLEKLYGEEKGSRVKYAEALEICEYGAPVTGESFHTLFPFFKRA
jgi:N-acetylglucosamine malate deacetylase 1